MQVPTAEANIGELCPAGEVRLGGGGERRCRAPYLVYGLTVLNALSSAESEREASRIVTKCNPRRPKAGRLEGWEHGAG